MSQKQAFQLRAKILGVLLRDARLSKGKSMKELGDVLDITAGRIASIERGTRSPSLPELELLAYYLQTPIDHFWKEKIVSEEHPAIASYDADSLLNLRNRTISTILRQARTENNLSQRDLAKRTGISAARIGRHESGESSVPLPELEHIAANLNYPIEAFSVRSGPVKDWIAQQKAIAQFLELPKNLQGFIVDSANRPYLEMARRLSNMSTARLREMGEGLQELSL